MRRLRAVTVAWLAVLAAPSGAAAQEQITGTITRAVDGDTIEVATPTGAQTVRLIGIDAPETKMPGTPVECGGQDASDFMSKWAGQPVTLTTDPTQDRNDRFGRLLAYADVLGHDLGLEAIEFGLSEVYVYDSRPFTRQPSYEAARDIARRDEVGAWSVDTCNGDFHTAATAEDDFEAGPTRSETAEQFVRSHYFRVSERRYSAAWAMLGATLRDRLGAYSSWRAGYRTTVSIRVNQASATLIGGGRAVVIARFRARDRDACTGGVRQQFFRARWVLSTSNDNWRATGLTASKVGGQRVRLSRSECPKPKPRPTPQPAPQPQRPPSDGGGSGCHPSYSPCVPIGRDYDCGELGGPYTVTGSDPYRLDGDGDGIGCE